MSCWGFFACGCIVHPRQLHHLSLGRQKATLGSFLGDGSGRFGLESWWGSPVSEPCSTEFLADDKVATSTEPTPGSCHHLSLGRQKATLGSFLEDGSGRFGLESCWGPAVSEPCSTEFLADEVATSTESTPGSCIIFL